MHVLRTFANCPHRSPLPVLFKGEPDSGGPFRPDRDDAPESETGEGGGRAVVCRSCGAKVAETGDRTSVDGGHSHVFFNPYGFVFEIECFSRAAGCALQGPPSTDFSWFAGFAWQICVCGRCGSHLGWRFASMDHSEFWGLISSMIEERDEEE